MPGVYRHGPRQGILQTKDVDAGLLGNNGQDHAGVAPSKGNVRCIGAWEFENKINSIIGYSHFAEVRQ